MVRIAALLCGLIAGLFALTAPGYFGVDLIAAFLKLWGAAPNQQLIGRMVWYAAPTAAIAGGLLALVAPGFSALLIFAAGVIWIGLGLSMPTHFDFLLIAPAAISGLGSILALLAGEAAVRRDRIVRRSRKNDPRVSANSEDIEREAAFRMDPLLVPRERAAPRPSMEIPLKLEDVVPEAAFAQSQPPMPPPQPQPKTPAREAPVWPESPPRRPLSERPPPVLREGVREPRSTSGSNWLGIANSVAVVLLAVAVIYLFYQDGQFARFFSGLAPTPTVEDVAAADPPEAPVAPAQVPETPKPTEPVPVLSLPMTADATAPAAPSPATVTPVVYTDPFAYCTAVKTVDYVDARYAGPRLTAEIANALRIPMNSAPDRVSWRCFEGVVLACASFDWPICAMTPTAEEMIEFCKRNPALPRLLAPNGLWSCENGRPKLPDDASWPVDARGFYPNGWITVPPAGTASTG